MRGLEFGMGMGIGCTPDIRTAIICMGAWDVSGILELSDTRW